MNTFFKALYIAGIVVVAFMAPSVAPAQAVGNVEGISFSTIARNPSLMSSAARSSAPGGSSAGSLAEDARILEPFLYKTSDGFMGVKNSKLDLRLLRPSARRLLNESLRTVNAMVADGEWKLNADGSLSPGEYQRPLSWIPGYGRLHGYWWGWVYEMDNTRTNWVREKLLSGAGGTISLWAAGIYGSNPYALAFTAYIMVMRIYYYYSFGWNNRGNGVNLWGSWVTVNPAFPIYVGRR